MATSSNVFVSPQFAGSRIVLELAHLGFWKLISRMRWASWQCVGGLKLAMVKNISTAETGKLWKSRPFIPLEPIIKSSPGHLCLKPSSRPAGRWRRSLGKGFCKCPASCLAPHCEFVLGDNASIGTYANMDTVSLKQPFQCVMGRMCRLLNWLTSNRQS